MSMVEHIACEEYYIVHSPVHSPCFTLSLPVSTSSNQDTLKTKSSDQDTILSIKNLDLEQGMSAGE